jgi:hypothetical protein
MSLIATIKAVGAAKVSKAAGFFNFKKPRVPGSSKGPRLGGIVQINAIAQLTVQSSFPDLQIAVPAGDLFIRWYGRIDDTGFVIQRYYLAENPDEDPTYILQYITTPNGTLVEGELTLWQESERIYPSSVDEWLVWVDERPEQTGIIGYPAFDCMKSGFRYWLLEQFPKEMRHQTIVDGESLNVAAPRTYRETVYMDVEGKQTITVNHQCMLYGRYSSNAPDATGTDAPRVELTWISAIDAGDHGAWVEIRKGIDLSENDVKII